MFTMLQQAETAVALVLGIATLAGLAKSFYNGGLRAVINNFKRIKRIDDRTQQIYRKQENTSEAVYYMSKALRGEAAPPDPEQIQEELGVERGPGRFRNQEREEEESE